MYLREAKVLNDDYRIRVLRKQEDLNARFLDILAEDREGKEVSDAMANLEKAKRKDFRKKVRHITQVLRNELFMKPNEHVGKNTMGKVRRYCVDKGKLPKKQKMTLTLQNVLEKWNSWFPETLDIEIF